MQVDQSPRQPWDRHKIADGREGYPGLPTGVGLQPLVGMGFDQTGFPGDMVKNARHRAILAISRRKHTSCTPAKDFVSCAWSASPKASTRFSGTSMASGS